MKRKFKKTFYKYHWCVGKIYTHHSYGTTYKYVLTKVSEKVFKAYRIFGKFTYNPLMGWIGYEKD